jgi:hypothetical protein
VVTPAAHGNEVDEARVPPPLAVQAVATRTLASAGKITTDLNEGVRIVVLWGVSVDGLEAPAGRGATTLEGTVSSEAARAAFPCPVRLTAASEAAGGGL